MSLVADYPDNSEHVAVAAQIAGTGVPLLTKPALLTSDLGRVIAGAGTFTEPAQAVTQPGYTIQVSVKFPAAATIPFVRVRLVWTDSVTSVQMNTDTFICAGNTAGAGLPTYLTGPCKADELSIALVNLDPAQSATVTVIAVQDSVVRATDEPRWNNGAVAGTTVPAFTLPTLPDDESVLGILDNVTIPASQSSGFLLGPHAGLVNIGYELSAGTPANLTIRLRPAPDTEYSGHNIIYAQASPPGNFQVAFPRSPVRLIVVNAATTAMVLSLSAIAASMA